jgi:nitrate/TMAO reductase-like tetraheme cytochrome c subunit
MGLPGLASAALAAAVLGAVSAAAGWWATDRLEQDDDFCNACHVSRGVPLHRDIRRDFDRRPPASLAAAHAAAPRAGRTSGGLRCIDCHGGTGLPGRMRVKALAARDAFFYTIGRFEEPRAMRWPLADADCRKCHARFDEGEPESGRPPRFHALPVHNARLGVACVECHRAHTSQVDAGFHFVDVSAVRAQCARCHSEFAMGG